MKNALIFGLLAALVAGCASSAKTWSDSAKPDPAVTDKPTLAMIEDYRAKKGSYVFPDMDAPRSADWQKANRAAIDAATAPAALDAVLASDASADALCSEVKPGYRGDPLKLTQLAAVSVYVMDKGNEAKRARWVAALKRAKEASATNDVDAFFGQQLLVCGY